LKREVFFEEPGNKKVAVITGAASGLGRAFADKAASQNMKLGAVRYP